MTVMVRGLSLSHCQSAPRRPLLSLPVNRPFNRLPRGDKIPSSHYLRSLAPALRLRACTYLQWVHIAQYKWRTWASVLIKFTDANSMLQELGGPFTRKTSIPLQEWEREDMVNLEVVTYGWYVIARRSLAPHLKCLQGREKVQDQVPPSHGA